VKKLNDDRRIIVDDILHWKISVRTFTYSFKKRCKERENTHTYVYYTKYVAILYKTNNKC
jgi:hypothetical protein